VEVTQALTLLHEVEVGQRSSRRQGPQGVSEMTSPEEMLHPSSGSFVCLSHTGFLRRHHRCGRSRDGRRGQFAETRTDSVSHTVHQSRVAEAVAYAVIPLDAAFLAAACPIGEPKHRLRQAIEDEQVLKDFGLVHGTGTQRFLQPAQNCPAAECPQRHEVVRHAVA
jgi:hypothetical protein